MLGIDMVEIARMARALEDPSFLPRFFTTKEVEYITSRKRPEEAAAGFFAAKEALSKALGTGVRGFGLKDISVTHTPLGKPTIRTTSLGRSIESHFACMAAEKSRKEGGRVVELDEIRGK